MGFDQKIWWQHVGSEPDIEFTKSHIWTPYASGEAWSPTEMYEQHLKILKENIDLGKVLDFGCGLGRNFSTLNNLFDEVHAFDTCPMIDKVVSIHEREGLGYEQLTCNWETHKSIKFDCVFECTVFQHIPVDELRGRLKDISKMTDFLVGTFRSFNDQDRDFGSGTGGYNMMQIIEEVDCYDIIDCSITPWEAMTCMDDTHYNILLKSR